METSASFEAWSAPSPYPAITGTRFSNEWNQQLAESGKMRFLGRLHRNL